MKKIFFVFAFMAFSLFSSGQDNDLTGSWKGALDVMGQKLPLVFNFEMSEEGWKGTADSPTQGAKGMKLKNVLFNGLMVSVEFERIPAIYEGVFVADTIKGTFTQSGTVFPLELTRLSSTDNLSMDRPQEPRPPFDYETIETSFQNESAGIKLVGTLTRPKGTGPFPAVVLVSGSGPQNRNGEVFGHNPFWVIADYLTKKGIAVLRYDERGVGESEGEFPKATSRDFKEDASLAISHLKKHPFVNQVKVGVIGHSEGGMIAWMLGAEDKNLNFLVALAAPVVPINELMAQQTEDILSAGGATKEEIDQQLVINNKVYQTMKQTEIFADLEDGLDEMIKNHLSDMGVGQEELNAEVSAIMQAYGPTLTPWFFEFLKFSSEAYIEKIQLPVFAGFAGKDIQVNSRINVEALKKIVSHNKQNQFKIITYPHLNHLFQKAETGTVSEYALNQETFNEHVLEEIVEWINRLK